MRGFLKRHWFLAGLICAIALGFAWPQAASGEGAFAPWRLTKAAVVGIFFMRGLLLPLREFRRGISVWRLHAVTQGYLFVITPLLMLILLAAWDCFLPLQSEWRLGFFFMAVLPTTISTAVLYTARAGGNVAGAIFNATSSNLLAVVLVPAWIGWFLAAEARAVPLAPVLVEVSLLLIAPLAAGQTARRWLAGGVDRNSRRIEIASNGLLLLIVFLVFAKSIQDGVWQEHTGTGLATTFIACIALYLLFQVGAAIAGRMARLSRSDYICHFYCAPQKTLAAGAPMASILFADNPELPIILLPILFYHFIQLLIGGLLIERFRKQEGQ